MGIDHDKEAAQEIAALKAEIERLKQVATGLPVPAGKNNADDLMAAYLRDTVGLNQSEGAHFFVVLNPADCIVDFAYVADLGRSFGQDHINQTLNNSDDAAACDARNWVVRPVVLASAFDAAKRLLAEMLEVFGKDGHGGDFEDGEFPLIDRVRAFLGEVVAAQHQSSATDDAKIVDFLAKRFLGPDFRYGDPAAEVVVIEMPKGCSYTGDLRRDIAAAMAKKGGAK